MLGHEGAGVVVEIGPGVRSVKPGDHVIPLYTPECRECDYCLSGKTNLCQRIRATQGKGLMPDGTSRFSYKGQMVHHYMGTSTFSELPILVDQGGADSFLERQLQPWRLESACVAAGHPIEVRTHPGYDHSYFFVATFIEAHIRRFAEAG